VGPPAMSERTTVPVPGTGTGTVGTTVSTGTGCLVIFLLVRDNLVFRVRISGNLAPLSERAHKKCLGAPIEATSKVALVKIL
jgi:hypothetical protein